MIMINLIMDAVHTSETSVYSETTRRYIPEGSNLLGKNFSDEFPIPNGVKQGDALSPIPVSFGVQYAIGRLWRSISYSPTLSCPVMMLPFSAARAVVFSDL
jgi:hypothetical protein